jgi:hypothetical protein
MLKAIAAVILKLLPSGNFGSGKSNIMGGGIRLGGAGA